MHIRSEYANLKQNSVIKKVSPSEIKIGDIKLKTILKKDVDVELLNNSQDYKNKIEREQEQREVIIINTYRQKTERYVPICCDYSTARHLLYYFCKGKTKNDYLIDCFNASKSYNEKQLQLLHLILYLFY